MKRGPFFIEVTMYNPDTMRETGWQIAEGKNSHADGPERYIGTIKSSRHDAELICKLLDKHFELQLPCGYMPGDCSGVCSVCGDNPENDREEP